MDLADLGLTDEISAFIKDQNLPGFTIGRVTQEHRERYIVSTGNKEYEAEITGNLRYTAQSRADFPAVGDWVAMMVFDHDLAIIHNILPRKTVLERQAVGKSGEKQIICTNIDFAFIVQSIDNNFSINRLERYLAICYSAGIEPVLVLSKIDLATEKEIKDSLKSLESRERKVICILISNITLEGIDRITGFIKKGMTYCVVGSSGVGKSTLINILLKRDVLKTAGISRSTNKGKHTTDHRELFVLENGGIIIDNPGMRELGMTDSIGGLNTTFREIADLALKCRFPGCRHINEAGCAVIDALNSGLIDKDSLDNYRKMLREQERFSETVAERRRKDREFGKMVKSILKEKKKTKFGL
jgi:ribosome biogenesis GTPase